jgi:hypothetical protein
MNSAPIGFFACPAYHGATLLGLILNNHSQLAALGDTLPERAHMDYFCSCGARVQNCDFWNRLAQATRANAHAMEPTLLPVRPRLVRNETANKLLNRLVFPVRPRLVRNETANKLLNRLVFGDRFISRSAYALVAARLRRFETDFNDFACAVCMLLKKTRFVDGTKDLQRLFVLAKANPGRMIYCIHLIRDPRGFVLSCKNNLPGPWDLKQSSLNWRRYHYLVLQLRTMLPNVRYLPVRYEDLCDRPGEQMQRIFAFMGMEQEDVLTAPRAPHHVIGNRMLREFRGAIAKDEKWRTQLEVGQQNEILRLTSPFSSTFRYTET